MSKIRKLTKPPIREAIFELQFQPLLDLKESELIQVKDLLNNQYTENKLLKEKKVEFRMEENKSTEIQDGELMVSGINLRDKSRNFIVMFTRERFSVINYLNYISFENLLDEFLRVLNVISSFTLSSKISRLGLRYMNEINYDGDYIKYLTGQPFPMMKSESEKITRHYSQLLLEFSNSEGGIINFVLDKKNKMFGIDIDLYTIQTDNIGNIENIKQAFIDLRPIKNKLFFQFITNRISEVL